MSGGACVMFRYATTLFIVMSIVGEATAQCPNLVARYQPPTSRTFATNNTWMLIKVPKDAVKQAVSEAFPALSITRRISLLDIPPEYGTPEDMHLVAATAGFVGDIRQSILQLDRPLLGSYVIVPFVSKDGSKTPLNAPLTSYLAGTGTGGDKYVYGLVPALVSTLAGGIPTKVGSFIPNDAAYQDNGLGPDGHKILSINAKWAALPNDISGPGIYIEAVDMHFSDEPSPKYSLNLLKKAINQPYLLNGLLTGRCQRNTYFFNNDTAKVEFRSGRVTLGPAASPNTALATLEKAAADESGTYEGVHGFSACAQMVGYDTLGGQDCEEAARSVDPAAL